MVRTFFVDKFLFSISFLIGFSDLAELLPELSRLFRMDRLLPRSLLLLSPIEMYKDLLRTGHFSALEVCVTMKKMLPDQVYSSLSDDLVIVNYTAEVIRFFMHKYWYFSTINEMNRILTKHILKTLVDRTIIPLVISVLWLLTVFSFLKLTMYI